MVALDFLTRGKKKVKVLNFNHGTEYGLKMQTFLRDYCASKNIEFCTSTLKGEKERRKSQEEFWRDKRYDFLRSNCDGKPIVTCHHLDDCIETWIFSSLRGKGKLIPYENRGVIRPFLLTPKKELYSWARNKQVVFFEDPSNSDERYTRNLIRNQITPHALKVNPGLHKTIARLVREHFFAEG